MKKPSSGELSGTSRHPLCISSCPKSFSCVTSQDFGSVPRYISVLRRYEGYDGPGASLEATWEVPPLCIPSSHAWRRALQAWISCLSSMPPPGMMSLLLWGLTLGLVSHCGTGPMLVLSLAGSPHAFPPCRGMGMLFPGLLLGG